MRMKKRIKIFLIVSTPLIILSVLANLFLAKPGSRLILYTTQKNGFTIRALKFKEDDGRYRGLAAVFWKMDKGKPVPLSPDEIGEILKSNSEGTGWTYKSEDNHYVRWKHIAHRSEATYRKDDYKLCLFSSDFVAWRKRKDFSRKDAQMFFDVVK